MSRTFSKICIQTGKKRTLEIRILWFTMVTGQVNRSKPKLISHRFIGSRLRVMQPGQRNQKGQESVIQKDFCPPLPRPTRPSLCLLTITSLSSLLNGEGTGTRTAGVHKMRLLRWHSLLLLFLLLSSLLLSLLLFIMSFMNFLTLKSVTYVVRKWCGPYDRRGRTRPPRPLETRSRI